MNRGGVETWLMHVFRNIDRKRFQMDFMTLTDRPGDYDEEIRALGGRIIPCSPNSQLWRHVSEFKAILRGYGPYDVVHSHDPGLNGAVMAISEKLGVPIRIAHCHCDVRLYPKLYWPEDVLRRLYVRWSIHQSKRCATHGLGSSNLAMASYFGKDWKTNPRWQVLVCGVDFTPFLEEVDSRAVRKSLRLPENAFVIGHVGSFRSREKNHSFLVEIARVLAELDKRIYFLLVGDGILRSEIENQVATAGLKERVSFTGVRSDVPRLMLGAMDLFLFPSIAEGLGLAMIEAQAAGLPCVCSDAIPVEAAVVPALTKRVSLSQPPSEWAKVILELRRTERAVSREQAFSLVEMTDFNIKKTVETLEELYATSRSVHS